MHDFFFEEEEDEWAEASKSSNINNNAASSKNTQASSELIALGDNDDVRYESSDLLRSEDADEYDADEDDLERTTHNQQAARAVSYGTKSPPAVQQQQQQQQKQHSTIADQVSSNEREQHLRDSKCSSDLDDRHNDYLQSQFFQANYAHDDDDNENNDDDDDDDDEGNKNSSLSATICMNENANNIDESNTLQSSNAHDSVTGIGKLIFVKFFVFVLYLTEISIAVVVVVMWFFDFCSGFFHYYMYIYYGVIPFPQLLLFIYSQEHLFIDIIATLFGHSFSLLSLMLMGCFVIVVSIDLCLHVVLLLLFFSLLSS